MELLMRDFDMDPASAAAILGNLGHESGGLTAFQEYNPTVKGSRGGFGWAQWTGPRRRQFEAYVKRNNLEPKSDRANYGFLFVELSGPEAKAIPAVKKDGTLSAKTKAFELAFERAGVKHYKSRSIWADRALTAWHEAKKPIILPEWVRGDALPPPDVPKPTPDTITPQPQQHWLVSLLLSIWKAFRR